MIVDDVLGIRQDGQFVPASLTLKADPLGTIMSIERTLRGFEAIHGRLESEIARDQKELAEYRMQSEKPFEYEE